MTHTLQTRTWSHRCDNLKFNPITFSRLFAISGSVMAKPLSYKSGGRGSDPIRRTFSVYLILPAAAGPGVYSASNKNEYQKQENNVSGEQGAAVAYD
jgi:hypothetical protein